MRVAAVRARENVERKKKRKAGLRKAWLDRAHDKLEEKDVKLDKELIRIATRGVVQLYTAIHRHQRAKQREEYGE